MLVSPWGDDKMETGGRDKEVVEGKIESFGVLFTSCLLKKINL